jgi:hypothetical protein
MTESEKYWEKTRELRREADRVDAASVAEAMRDWTHAALEEQGVEVIRDGNSLIVGSVEPEGEE